MIENPNTKQPNEEKVRVVQKVQYGILAVPVFWLLFSIWAVINELFSNLASRTILAIETPPSFRLIFNLTILSLCALWVLGKTFRNIRGRIPVSAELKSGLAFLVGMIILDVSDYFVTWQFLSYVGMAVLDIAPIIALVTLLQDKSFAGFTLYRKDVEIRKDV